MGLSQWSSSSFFMHALILLWWCGLLVTSVVGGNNETDRLALLAFKAKITDDPLQVMSSWNDSIHFCQWQGVTCGRRHQRVIVLDLRTSKLVGSISPHVGNLSFLNDLILSNNSFHDEIPSKIDRLHRLQVLRLYNNSLRGKIPRNLSHCTNLNYINFGRNLLDGEIPATLGTLSKLQFINFEEIACNNFGGELPKCIANFPTTLIYLLLNNNTISGNIPTGIGNLTNLEELDMGNNKLSGHITFEIGKLHKLQILDLSANNIFGNIPYSLGNLTILITLYLHDNNLQGSIPLSLGKCENVIQLSLAKNNLNGTISYQVVWKNSIKSCDVPTNGVFKNTSATVIKGNDAFSTTNLIGVGSFGSVYRGILDHDRRKVAVKVLNLLQHGVSKSFIAECEALRNIRHRNLVKLHPVSRRNEVPEEQTNLNFLQRLNIAIDVANALEYLHKPSNVLLDDE
nr:receptor kinase-like protein Xa21 [Quercus suber]